VRADRVVLFEMPDQVGHDGRERAIYIWLLIVLVLTLALSGFKQSSQQLARHPHSLSRFFGKSGDLIIKFHKAIENEMSNQLGHDVQGRVVYI
jgi:hypothetical protein